MAGSKTNFWSGRIRASSIHLVLSIGVAALAGALVFGFWYPYPYREISGGRELFLLVVTVDVILGPLITLAVFNRTKPWLVLRRDLLVVALIQLAALGYGLWTVFVARPVHLVFEYDRFRVIHAVDVPPEFLAAVPDGVQAMPLFGPTTLSLRPFKNANEKVEMTMAALQGLQLSVRTNLWQPYAMAREDVLRVAKPASQLKARFPARATEIDTAIATAGRRGVDLSYLPMIGRKSFWTVFVDPTTADVVGFMPLDSF